MQSIECQEELRQTQDLLTVKENELVELKEKVNKLVESAGSGSADDLSAELEQYRSDLEHAYMNITQLEADLEEQQERFKVNICKTCEGSQAGSLFQLGGRAGSDIIQFGGRGVLTYFNFGWMNYLLT